MSDEFLATGGKANGTIVSPYHRCGKEKISK